MGKQKFLLACAAAAVCAGGARAQTSNVTVYKMHSVLASSASTPTTAPNVIAQSGYYAAGDGGWAEYDWNATSTATADGVTVILPNGQSSGTAGRYIIRGTVANAVAYGADPTGRNDSTAAINNALANGPNATNPSGGKWAQPCVYLPAGNYKVTDAINLPAINGCLFGDGRMLTTLQVDSASFNLSALGVIVMPGNSGGTSSWVHDLGVSFTQPDTSSRSSLVAFPPGIYAQSASRPMIKNVRIGGGNYCIDARGNDGGAFLDNIECGSLVKGLQMGTNGASPGALDGVHITGWHFWNFSQAGGPGLSSIYSDGTNISMELGRVDWLSVTDSQNFNGNINILADASNSVDQWTWTNVSMDSGAWDQAGGTIYVANMQNATAGNGPNGGSGGWPTAIAVSAGHLTIANADIGGAPTSAGMINVSGTGSVSINGGVLSCGSITPTTAYASCAQVSGGTLSLSRMSMAPNSAVSWASTPFVSQTGGALQFFDNTFNNAGNGVGVAFAATSNANRFSFNSMSGWTTTFPATLSIGSFFNYNASTLYGASYTLNNSGSGAANLFINPTDGSAAWETFENAGAAEWRIGNLGTAGSNKFGIRDIANSGADWLEVAAGGSAQVGESSSSILTIRGSALTSGYAISSLPTCNGPNKGLFAYVTDGQSTPPYLGTVSTAGTAAAPVFCNGKSWVYH